ncbi:hypothetical protein [Pseudonocardia phyllosphaerae]|uniref:hypothetical protein n=1 Tax=Pseudonocardia phyllosphaerae TaxID=3390502 RepID=UPI00397BD65E
MTRTLVRPAVALAVAATAALVLTPAAGAAPRPAQGTAVALAGTTADGASAPVSRVLENPDLGVCQDLTTPDGRPATWTRFVNGTDRVALVSPLPCTAQAEPAPAAPATAASGQQIAAGQRSDRPVRSVRFSAIP